MTLRAKALLQAALGGACIAGAAWIHFLPTVAIADTFVKGNLVVAGVVLIVIAAINLFDR